MSNSDLSPPAATLEKLGLSAKESRLYSRLLETGRSTVSGLAEASGYKRGDLHYLLKLLEKRGLISRRRVRNRDIVVAETPLRLRELVERQRQAVENQQNMLQGILPRLVSQYVLTNEKPAIRYLEGLAGMGQVYREILEQKKDIRLFASIHDRKNPELNKLINRAIPKQARAGLKVRALVPFFPELDQGYLDYSAKFNIANRILPLAKFSLPAQIMIFGGTVALTSIRDEIVTTIINHPNIARTLSAIFDLIWELSAPLQAGFLAEIKKRPGKAFRRYI